MLISSPLGAKSWPVLLPSSILRVYLFPFELRSARWFTLENYIVPLLPFHDFYLLRFALILLLVAGLICQGRTCICYHQNSFLYISLEGEIHCGDTLSHRLSLFKGQLCKTPAVCQQSYRLRSKKIRTKRVIKCCRGQAIGSRTTKISNHVHRQRGTVNSTSIKIKPNSLGKHFDKAWSLGHCEARYIYWVRAHSRGKGKISGLDQRHI